MFVYDYLLTLEMEIELVWKSKWNWIKFVYLFQRYLPFIDTVFLAVFSEFSLCSTMKRLNLIWIVKSGKKTASECWHLYFAHSCEFTT